MINLSQLINNQQNNQYIPCFVNQVPLNNLFMNQMNQPCIILVPNTDTYNMPTVGLNINAISNINLNSSIMSRNITPLNTINNIPPNVVLQATQSTTTTTTNTNNMSPNIMDTMDKNKGSFLCNTCGRAFKHKSNMFTHRKLHQPDCPKCQHCGKKFARKSNLLAHIRIHTNERPFKCSYKTCTKSYRQPHCLKDHLRSHSGEKPFQCQTCLKKFTIKHNMVIHCRIHTGEKPYQCQTCKKRYVSKSGLNSHRKHIHSKHQ